MNMKRGREEERKTFRKTGNKNLRLTSHNYIERYDHYAEQPCRTHNSTQPKIGHLYHKVFDFYFNIFAAIFSSAILGQ